LPQLKKKIVENSRILKIQENHASILKSQKSEYNVTRITSKKNNTCKKKLWQK